MAHFEPDTITLRGEGVFPRITFNLPREMATVSLNKRGLGGEEVATAAVEPYDITVSGSGLFVDRGRALQF